MTDFKESFEKTENHLIVGWPIIEDDEDLTSESRCNDIKIHPKNGDILILVGDSGSTIQFINLKDKTHRDITVVENGQKIKSFVVLSNAAILFGGQFQNIFMLIPNKNSPFHKCDYDLIKLYDLGDCDVEVNQMKLLNDEQTIFINQVSPNYALRKFKLTNSIQRNHYRL